MLRKINLYSGGANSLFRLKGKGIDYWCSSYLCCWKNVQLCFEITVDFDIL